MSDLTASQLTRRYLILRATRWFPTGLIIPVFVLYLIDKGLSLGQIGLVTATQGLLVLLLELPTGGLADAIGRKRVLVVANLFELISITMILTAPSLAWFMVAFGIQGVYRALESGPLDAWFVDGLHQDGAHDQVEKGLGRGGMVIGAALAAGSICGGGLVAWDPIPGLAALSTPLVFNLVLRTVDTVALVILMSELRPALGIRAVMESARAVPIVIKSALAVLGRSVPLRLLLAIEVTWGVGAIAWEGLFPARLGEIVGIDEAASLMGPLAAVAWASSAAGSGLVMLVSKRLGRHRTAALIRGIQAITVVAMGALGGVVGIAVAYLTCFAMLGASSPVHMAMVHDEAEASNRTTVTSLNNMCGMAAASLAGIVLGFVADASGVPMAMFIAAAVVAAAAPLYLIAGRRTRALAKAV